MQCFVRDPKKLEKYIDKRNRATDISLFEEATISEDGQDSLHSNLPSNLPGIRAANVKGMSMQVAGFARAPERIQSISNRAGFVRNPKTGREMMFSTSSSCFNRHHY